MANSGERSTVGDAAAACPHADFALPWDDAGAPAPVDALRRARAELGDTFTVHSGDDDYLFLFSDEGLRSFYGLEERQASKGLADYQMLLRKLPPELFEGRRTFAHDLFGAQDVEEYLGRLDLALTAELATFDGEGTFEAFALARRLGHRLGLACWIGPEVASGPRFDELVADVDRLDGAEAFVHPETIAAVRESDYAEERDALARVEAVVREVLAERDEAEREQSTEIRPGDFLGRIASRWDDVEEPARTQGIARDVVLLHVATMTNLVAALGWTLVRVLHDPTSLRAIATGDAATADRCALEAIRLGQRSIMMRTALRPLELDDGTRTCQVDRGTIVATMVPVTNVDAEPSLSQWSPDRWRDRLRSGPEGLTTPEQVTTFGHGSHRCPARRFSMSAIRTTMTRLLGEFDLVADFDQMPGPLTHQIGGVGRAAAPCPVRYRRH